MPHRSQPQAVTLPDQFDGPRFARLLELAGPTMAPTLLAQLDEDLAACQRKLDTALGAADFGQLRQASHDLIALSGSCGAETLHQLARLLNDTAHRQSLPPAAALQHQIADQLQALVGVIRATARGQRPW